MSSKTCSSLLPSCSLTIASCSCIFSLAARTPSKADSLFCSSAMVSSFSFKSFVCANTYGAHNNQSLKIHNIERRNERMVRYCVFHLPCMKCLKNCLTNMCITHHPSPSSEHTANHITSHCITSRHIISRHIASHCITSHYISSHHIT